jgi:hypothetical protein
MPAWIGRRLSLSEVGSTAFLVGAYIDVKDGSVLIAAEASRRFGENWKSSLEGRGHIPQGENVLEYFQNDSQIQTDIEYHYRSTRRRRSVQSCGRDRRKLRGATALPPLRQQPASSS